MGQTTPIKNFWIVDLFRFAVRLRNERRHVVIIGCFTRPFLHPCAQYQPSPGLRAEPILFSLYTSDCSPAHPDRTLGNLTDDDAGGVDLGGETRRPTETRSSIFRRAVQWTAWPALTPLGWSRNGRCTTLLQINSESHKPQLTRFQWIRWGD